MRNNEILRTILQGFTKKKGPNAENLLGDYGGVKVTGVNHRYPWGVMVVDQTHLIRGLIKTL